MLLERSFYSWTMRGTRLALVLAGLSLLRGVEEALEQAQKTREVFLRLGEDYWACVLDNNTAMIYDHMGRFQDELNLYENLRAVYPTLTSRSETSIKRSIALAEMNQAGTLASLGNFEQAFRLLQQAQAGFTTLNETELITSAEIDLAELDFIQGYYGSALRRYYQARDSLIQNDPYDPMLLAILKLRMANCLVKLNRAHEACLLANEAVETYRQAGNS